MLSALLGFAVPVVLVTTGTVLLANEARLWWQSRKDWT